MRQEYKIKEIYNPKEKNIEEKLQEVLITFLAEKTANNLEKNMNTRYNANNRTRGNYCYRKGETMITIKNPEKYIAGLYERLSNEKIEIGNGKVIINDEDERESRKYQHTKIIQRKFLYG